MRVVFKVKTPKGQATGTNNKIKMFIIGFNKVKVETFVNEDDSEILWTCDGHLKYIMKIQANLWRFDSVMKNVFEHKLMQKFGTSKLTKEEFEQLEDMLKSQTSLEIIKEATLQERDEYNETWLDKIKKNWKKFNPFSPNEEANNKSNRKKKKQKD